MFRKKKFVCNEEESFFNDCIKKGIEFELIGSRNREKEYRVVFRRETEEGLKKELKNLIRFKKACEDLKIEYSDIQDEDGHIHVNMSEGLLCYFNVASQTVFTAHGEKYEFSAINPYMSNSEKAQKCFAYSDGKHIRPATYDPGILKFGDVNITEHFWEERKSENPMVNLWYWVCKKFNKPKLELVTRVRNLTQDEILDNFAEYYGSERVLKLAGLLDT
jgi:hypothetical protein